MRRRFLSGLIPGLLVLAIPGCGGDPTGPELAVCETVGGAEVCALADQYRSGQTVNFTIQNTTNGPIYKDSCSTRLEGVTTDVPFPEIWDPRFRCGQDATQADVIANMVEIAPGETVEDSLTIISFAFQGFYRVNVWLLNADGSLAEVNPAHSGVFRVFPAAN